MNSFSTAGGIANKILVTNFMCLTEALVAFKLIAQNASADHNALLVKLN